MRSISPIASATVEHQTGPRGRFLLRVASGEVSLRGVEGDRVRLRADDEAAFRKQFSVDAGDGYLEIRQNDKLGLGIFSRNESVDIEVEVPHGAGVRIDSQSGDIEAYDLSGEKSFRSASGEIELHRLAGPADVETVSGDVHIEGAAPVDLRAKTVSGDVEIRVPVVRRLDLGTTSGDAVVDAELKGDGPFAIRTISGDVLIVGRSGFRVEAESITGDMSSELPAKRESMPGRKILVVGRPGPTLSFRSVSGDFAVVEPRQAAQALEEEPMNDRDGATAEGAAPVEIPSADSGDAKRLEILQQLERGEISVAEAGDRLGALDEVVR